MKHLFDVSNQVVVVSGGAGLIGKEIVSGFRERGAHVVILDAMECVDLHEDLRYYKCNVANTEQLIDIRDEVIHEFGKIDVLINSHQYKPSGFLDASLEDFPEQLWHDVLDINLTGTFKLCKIFGQSMLKQGKGSIINFGSTYGVVSSNPGLYTDNSLGNPVAYSVSKAGIIMLTKYLGVHWAKKGVRVNAITPHGVENNHEIEFINRFSQLSPMGRLMNASEVLGAVLYLASDASSYATGSNMLIEGGWTQW